jgi:hypothetical protein
MRTIVSVSELQNTLETAKCGGQFVTVYYETDVKGLLKNPTDGSAVGKRREDFTPKKRSYAQFHFAQDYEKTMAKILGVDEYNAEDSNREHLIKNVLVRYKSTKNICLIAMPCSIHKLGYTLNGRMLTDEEIEYMNHYWSKAKRSTQIVEYRTIGVKNIYQLSINGEVIQVKIASLE